MGSVAGFFLLLGFFQPGRFLRLLFSLPLFLGLFFCSLLLLLLHKFIRLVYRLLDHPVVSLSLFIRGINRGKAEFLFLNRFVG